MLFHANYETKIRKYDKNIHKAVRITIGIHQTNEKFSITVQPKMHVNLNLQITYAYNFFINHSLTLKF